MLRPYRCLLCGETYLGESQPDRCPYCGAAGKQLVPAAEWFGQDKFDLTESDRLAVEESMKLELSNTGFYTTCAKKAETPISAAIFKRLSKQELEHAEVFARILGIAPPPVPAQDCAATDPEKYAESHMREDRAIKLYLDHAAKVTHLRLREIFRILSEIEGEHLKISNVYR